MFDIILMLILLGCATSGLYLSIWLIDVNIIASILFCLNTVIWLLVIICHVVNIVVNGGFDDDKFHNDDDKEEDEAEDIK